MSKVLVYRFKKSDINKGESVLSQNYATKEAITLFEAKIIESSEIEVDSFELDGNGIYKIKDK